MSPRHAPSWGKLALTLAWRSALFAGLAWVLAEGRMSSAYIAAAAVIGAAAASVALVRPVEQRWHPAHLARLVAYFFRESLAGGVDVAWRAFSPGLPVAPALQRFELGQLTGFQAVIFVWLVNLMPGTASAELRDGLLMVHVLDAHSGALQKLATLETLVARAFA